MTRDSSITDRDDNPATYQYDRRANSEDYTSAVFFEFDPNTLDEAGWKKLGVPARTIKTILKYREKGGRFRKPEDLQRVYGLSPALYKKLASNVQIQDRSPVSVRSDTGFKRTYLVRRSVPDKVDINLADTTAFIALPGIGNKLNRSGSGDIWIGRFCFSKNKTLPATGKCACAKDQYQHCDSR
jgi:hypothetical protein